MSRSDQNAQPGTEAYANQQFARHRARLADAIAAERTAQANIHYHAQKAAIWQNRVDEWNLNGVINEDEDEDDDDEY
ncbi:hypothetical protein GQX73_g7011 [Xylaria multiplex]|uniref:Uncharacterized protein n=1 Tax=Xylaria multiplex TaxID=323545 RepID=A0A7C8IP41_9PEZI|nr:hypothetical protein GQX73_g7011 [Xylaria multiplex]